jgi:ubiquinone biosynthesis protein COQ9
VRIEPWADHRESVRRALTLLALPTNVAAAARITWHTADTLWHAAGDTSADFSYYTKRASLAAVYSSTLLYWLEDGSDGSADSWEFLNRRLADTLRLTKLSMRTRQRFHNLRNPLNLLCGQNRSPRRRFGVREG